MIVDCENCHTKFKLADEKVTARGVKIRCSKCAHIFVVRKEVAEDLVAPAPAAPPKSAARAEESDPFAGVDFGTGKLGAGAPAPSAPPAAAGGIGNSKSGVDELEAMFGPSKAAPPPPPKPPASRPPAPLKRAPEADPFGDAMTLDTGGGEEPPARSPVRESPKAPARSPARAPVKTSGKSDPFGGLFESTSDSSSQNAASGEAAAGDGETSGPSGEDFNEILTGGGAPAPQARGAPREEDTLGEGESSRQSSEPVTPSPSVQWGQRKGATGKGGAAGGGLPAAKVAALILAPVFLLIGVRGALEFAPQSFLDMGIGYETLVGLRGFVPFFAENPEFPKPQMFWDAGVDRTFVVNHQSGKRFFVAVGHVTNKGPGKRSFFAVTVQALDAAGEPLGLPQKTYAGNEMDVDALSRVSEQQIRETLGNKLGSGGANFEVPPGKSLPFDAVFFDLPQDAAGAKVVTVEAVAAAG